MRVVAAWRGEEILRWRGGRSSGLVRERNGEIAAEEFAGALTSMAEVGEDLEGAHGWLRKGGERLLAAP